VDRHTGYVKTLLYTLAAMAGIVALLSFIFAGNALNEVFAAVVGLGGIVCLIGATMQGAKPRPADNIPSRSSAVRYDPASTPEPKSKRPRSAIRYP